MVFQDSLKIPTTWLSRKAAKPNPQKLAKYDEAPSRANQADITSLSNLKLGDDSLNRGEKWGFSLLEERETRGNTASKSCSVDEGASKKGWAKSRVYEICAANYWSHPIFECCKEEGPSHAKMYVRHLLLQLKSVPTTISFDYFMVLNRFTFKVTLEIQEASTTVLECFSAPQPKKKAAAEHAAEGALWYLKHIGYSSKED